MQIADVMMLALFLGLNLGITIWCYRTEVVGNEQTFDGVHILRKRDQGRRWFLILPMLFWFVMSLWVWNRTDPLSPTTVDVFGVIKVVGITMAIVTAGLLSTFGEKENLEWKEYDEESSVMESDDAKIAMQSRLRHARMVNRRRLSSGSSERQFGESEKEYLQRKFGNEDY